MAKLVLNFTKLADGGLLYWDPKKIAYVPVTKGQERVISTLLYGPPKVEAKPVKGKKRNRKKMLENLAKARAARAAKKSVTVTIPEPPELADPEHAANQ